VNSSWITDEIDNLCNVEYGTRVVQKNDGGTIYPVYGGGGATFFMDIFNREDRLTIARFAMSAKCTRFVKGKFFLNDSGLTLSPKDKSLITKEFLDYQCLAMNDVFYSLAKGSAQKNLDVPAFRKLKLNIPIDIKIQKKIVAKLDTLFAEIDKATMVAEANANNADALFHSYLTEIFEYGGDSWLTTTIGNLCTELFAGGDVPKDRMSKSETSDFFIPIFTNGEKDKGLYGFTNTPRVTKPSITISARGTIGYSEVRYKPFFPAIRLLVATPNTEIIELDYLKYAIKSLKFIHSGASIPQLTVPMVKNYQIKLPKSKKEQIEIIRKLDKLSIEIENLRNSALKKLIQLTNLRQSILNQAFNGELLKE
jgi:type I restriction enzyme S subunit